MIVLKAITHLAVGVLGNTRPPGSAMPSRRAAMLTLSPIRCHRSPRDVAQMDADAELDVTLRRKTVLRHGSPFTTRQTSMIAD